MRSNLVNRMWQDALSHIPSRLLLLICSVLIMMLTLLPILWTDSTALGAIDIASDRTDPNVAAITCYGRDIVDPVSPDFGSLAFVTNYFPTTIDTYYLDGLYETVSSHWHISETGLVWTQLGDTATLKGEVINNANNSQRLAINYTFQPRYNWTQWSALGRTYHPKGWSLPHTTWDYWELKEGTLEGKDTLSGTLSIFHLPTDYYEGFQVGQDTLPRNSGFSISGWFGASGAINNETVSVDAYGYLYMLLDCDGSTTPTSTPTPAPTATSPPQVSGSTVVCSANSYVDSSVPQYGNLALGTNYLPTTVQTYYDAEYKLFSASSHWNIYGNGVSWTVSESDGVYSARLYGEVVNNYNGNQRLLIDFSFQNRYSWAEWSALGRTADPLDNSLPYDTWDYWELREGTLTGQGDLNGTINVTHRPSSYITGFQVGNNVLIRNPGYGISGWYNMSGTLNGQQLNSTYAYGAVYMLLNCQSTVPPTPTRTPIPTATWTPRPTVTPLPPTTSTPVPSAPTVVPTHTPIPAATLTHTPIPTATPTHTPIPSATATDTPVPTATLTATLVPTSATTDAPATNAPTVEAPTDVPTATPTFTPTVTSTATDVPTETATATELPIETPTITNTPEPDATATPIVLSLGNRVWLDADNNGFLDDSESGIRDVIVRLLTDPDGDGNYQDVVQTTATNALGYYLFTGLSEGLYVIEVEPPVGLGSSTGGASEPAPDPDTDQDDRDDNGSTVGTVIRSEPIELTISQEPLGEDNKPGQLDPASDNNSNLTVDFGLYELDGSIGDTVWRDLNEDGIQDEGEPGVAGVVVNLWTYNDKDNIPETKLATTTTDANGNYRFDDLDPTLIYVIEVELGADQFLTKPDVNENGNDDVDSDVRYTGDGGDRGLSGPIILDAGEYDDTIDIGITVPKQTPEPTTTTVPTATPTFTSVPTNTPEPTATQGPTPTATPTTPPIAGPEPEEGMIVRVDDYVAGTGDVVQIMVEGFNLDGMATATMEFSFDPTVLSPIECNKDPDSQFDLVQCNLEFDDDTIRFNITSLRGVSGDIRLAELTFEVIGENGDTSPIAIEVITFASPLGAKLEHTVRNGNFTVSTARRGDVNCSGERNIVDALMISQYEAGMREATYSCDGNTPRAVNSIYMPSCDTDGNKQCDTIDSLFILQCEAGIPNSLCGRGLSATTGDEITSVDEAASTLTMHRIIPGTPNGSVTLPVVAAMTKDKLYSAVLDVHYDPNVLRPLECTTNNLTQRNEPILALCNTTFENNGQDNDLARFNMVSADGLEGIAELFEITFEVIGEVPDVNILSMKPIVFTDREGETLSLKVNYIDDGEIVGQNISIMSTQVFLPIVQR